MNPTTRVLRVLLTTAGLLLPPTVGWSETIIVSAAASLTNAFQHIGAEFTRLYPAVTVRFNFGSSGGLQQQIEQGAPVDVFAAASPKEMNSLEKKGYILAATRRDFTSNTLVLIAPLHSSLRNWRQLASSKISRVSISNPASVPSGRYARATLKHKNLWQIVKLKAVLGDDVRQTLAYVMEGDCQAGIVFRTDALFARGKVKIVKSAVPGKDLPPITYPIALLKSSHHPLYGEKFIQFVCSPAGQKIMKRYGFTQPTKVIHKVKKH